MRLPVPASRLARYELRRFRGPLPKVALVFVLIIPLLYGAIYLTANWDPYGRLDRLPVAVVNEDQPVTYDGKQVHAGQDFVDNLIAGKDFGYAVVDEDEALRGLREGDYYLAITVPESFSAHLISGAGNDPQRAQIMLRRNDANGFVIGSITARAQDSIARAVDESAVASYFDAVFANLTTIRSGLQDAAEGAGRLSDGASSADEGAAKLADGAKSAASGSATLAGGAQDLAAGLRTLTSGSADLATGAGKVADGTQQLDDTVVPVLTDLQKKLPQIQSHAKEAGNALDDVTAGLADRSGSVSADLSAASAALEQLKKDNPELADDENFKRVQARVDSAAARSDEVADTARDAAGDVHAINQKVQATGDLSTPVTQAKDKLVALNNGAHQVASGAKKLSGGISDASAGADKVATGADTLHSGLTQLSSGADALHAGTTKLAAGAKELHDKLAAAVKRIPALSQDQQDDAVQVLSSPADVTMHVDNPAGVYGRGLAPMFFSIAIWVFGISVFLVVRPISGRALAGRARPWRLALTGWLPIGIFAVLGALLMLGVVWLFLGLAPVHPLMIIGMTALGALCFSAIAHLLRSALGTPGSSILLVWLILQLTSAGGTYPAPILPAFFQAIAPFMPMTYLIDAYRIVISGGEPGHLARDAAILLAGTALALLLGVLVVRRRQQFGHRDLHPPLVSP